MKEIIATVDVTTRKGQWLTMKVRLPYITPPSQIEQSAKAKAQAELGPATRGFWFSLLSWKVVEKE